MNATGRAIVRLRNPRLRRIRPWLVLALTAVAARAPAEEPKERGIRPEDLPRAESRLLDWRMGLGDLKGPLQFVAPADLRRCEIERSEGGVRATWKGHPRLGDDCTVRADWRRQPDGRWSGAFSYDGFTGGAFVEEIHFPVFSGPFTPTSRWVFAGWDCGLVFRGPAQLKPGARIRRPFAGAMQFSAAVNDGATSFYFDHRDPAWSSKACEFAVATNGASFTYAGLHYPGHGDRPATAYRIPYESSIAEFSGDWFEAGRIYRSWGTAQRWNARRAGGNPLRKIGLWVWNRGLIADVLPPVERLQKELGDVPVALDWYWWHSNPYDTDYPDFWPPREGVDAFRAAVSRLKRAGIYSQVYINGVCWDLDGKSWAEGGNESVVMLRDGQPRNNAFNKYNHHRLAFMCGEAPKFQDRISALVGHLRASGLDGQYLDMIGCASYERCYNPAHRHPRGGGAAGPEGFRAMLERLKKENPGYALTTECCNEPYMDLLDGAIVCNSTSQEHLGGGAEPIPLFQSVYHGGFAYFGNYAHPDGVTPWDPLWPPEDRWKTEKPWHRLYPDQFFFELGRTVAWGAQPMVCHIREGLFADPEFAEIRRFIFDTARFYHANREFLFDGEMLSPAGFACADASVEFMARMIFTKEGQCRVLRKEMPAILHSCWRSPAGAGALILVNWTSKPQAWTFRNLSGTVPAHTCEKHPLAPPQE